MVCFRELQRLQAGTMFSIELLPPLDRGVMWSRLNVSLVKVARQ